MLTVKILFRQRHDSLHKLLNSSFGKNAYGAKCQRGRYVRPIHLSCNAEATRF